MYDLDNFPTIDDIVVVNLENDRTLLATVKQLDFLNGDVLVSWTDNSLIPPTQWVPVHCVTDLKEHSFASGCCECGALKVYGSKCPKAAHANYCPESA